MSNRIIKFRLINCGKIVGYEEHELDTPSGTMNIYHNTYNIEAVEDSYIWHDEKDQYTGLLDKNGTEIYEGDIAKAQRIPDMKLEAFSRRSPEERQVEWDDEQELCHKTGCGYEYIEGFGRKGPIVFRDGRFKWGCQDIKYQVDAHNLEVIGTIHDKEKTNDATK